MRPLLSYSKVQRAIAKAIRNRAIFARRPEHGAYIDIGCGPNLHTGFYHIDYSWRPGVQLCWDITRALPINDDSIGGVFTEHCVEHIAFEQFLSLVGEIHRVMTPSARLRIVVPDGELYARGYLNGTPLPYHREDAEGAGFYTPMMSVNRIFYKHGHRFIYDFETMRAILERAGFVDVERCEFMRGRDQKLLVDSPTRVIESLYLEAVKA